MKFATLCIIGAVAAINIKDDEEPDHSGEFFKATETK